MILKFALQNSEVILVLFLIGFHYSQGFAEINAMTTNNFVERTQPKNDLKRKKHWFLGLERFLGDQGTYSGLCRAHKLGTLFRAQPGINEKGFF